LSIGFGKNTANRALIGIHGESMGAVTTLLYAGMDDADADFYVADCPFATLRISSFTG
jgi:hypothetical protein